MKSFLSFSALISMAALCAACSQQPADVVYKGSQYFGREHEGKLDSGTSKTYSSQSARYKKAYVRNVESADVSSVNVSDLPPPSSNPSAAQRRSSHATGGHVTSESSPYAKNTHMLGIDGSNRSEPLSREQVTEDTYQDQTQSPSEPVKSAVKESSSRFIWPVDGGTVISHFEGGKNGNDGINIAMSEGEPIYAAADGSVVYSGSELKGYGNMIILKHNGGWMTAYAHARGLEVKKGAKVKQGDLIGYVGATGNVKKSQLHFVVRKGKVPVDPEAHLPPL